MCATMTLTDRMWFKWKIIFPIYKFVVCCNIAHLTSKGFQHYPIKFEFIMKWTRIRYVKYDESCNFSVQKVKVMFIKWFYTTLTNVERLSMCYTLFGGNCLKYLIVRIVTKWNTINFYPYIDTAQTHLIFFDCYIDVDRYGTIDTEISFPKKVYPLHYNRKHINQIDGELDFAVITLLPMTTLYEIMALVSSFNFFCIYFAVLQVVSIYRIHHPDEQEDTNILQRRRSRRRRK